MGSVRRYVLVTLCCLVVAPSTAAAAPSVTINRTWAMDVALADGVSLPHNERSSFAVGDAITVCESLLGSPETVPFVTTNSIINASGQLVGTWPPSPEPPRAIDKGASFQCGGDVTGLGPGTYTVQTTILVPSDSPPNYDTKQFQITVSCPPGQTPNSDGVCITPLAGPPNAAEVPLTGPQFIPVSSNSSGHVHQLVVDGLNCGTAGISKILDAGKAPDAVLALKNIVEWNSYAPDVNAILRTT